MCSTRIMNTIPPRCCVADFCVYLGDDDDVGLLWCCFMPAEKLSRFSNHGVLSRYVS